MKTAENFDFDVRQVMSLACRAIDENKGGRVHSLEKQVALLESQLQRQQIQLDELKKTLIELQRQQQLERQHHSQQSRKHQQLQRELLRQQPYRHLVKI
jgi:predicted RNase H-like nuclease (RuvC/YqgF family)